MDTNRNDGQNYQINTFNKGMNTDTALDAVGEGQYIFGLNIRISNNVLLEGNVDPNSKEGLVTPITIGEEKTLIDLENVDRILATGSIGDVGVVIVRYIADIDPVLRKWKVYKVVKNGDSLTTALLYESKSTTTKDKFSIVLNKELEDIIKLYIADGDHGIMQLFVEGGANPDYEDRTDDDLVSGKYFPSDKAIIKGTCSGKLKTQLVQYTYRFYKRYGIFSKLAPLTNKFLIINSNRNVENGNAENTYTNIGIQLQVGINDTIKLLFDHIQLIRVSYIVAGLLPEIDIVKDVKFNENLSNYLEIADIGENTLQQLSLDEFSALNSTLLIPQVIEQNQGFMFAANVKDDTIFDPNIPQDYFKTDSYAWDFGEVKKISSQNINDPIIQLQWELDKNITNHAPIVQPPRPEFIEPFKQRKDTEDDSYGGSGFSGGGIPSVDDIINIPNTVVNNGVDSYIVLARVSSSIVGDSVNIVMTLQSTGEVIQSGDSVPADAILNVSINGVNSANIQHWVYLKLNDPLDPLEIPLTNLCTNITFDLQANGIDCNFALVCVGVNAPAPGRYYNFIGGENDNISWNLVYGSIAIANTKSPTLSIEDPYVLYFDDKYPTVGSIYKLVSTVNPNHQKWDGSELLCTIQQYLENVGLSSAISLSSYDDPFTSSILRSLRRGETYRYGIILYNKYGQRSNAFYIADIYVPDERYFQATQYLEKRKTDDELNPDKSIPIDSAMLSSVPVGVQFSIKNLPEDVVGYEIVRCEKTPEYTKILLLCALSRPVHQGRWDLENYRTPYYPSFLITTQFMYIENPKYFRDWRNETDLLHGVGMKLLNRSTTEQGIHTTSWLHPISIVLNGDPFTMAYHTPLFWRVYETWGDVTDDIENSNTNIGYFDKSATNTENKILYQLFAPEILMRRIDTLQLLLISNTSLSFSSYKTPTVYDYGLGLSEGIDVDENKKEYPLMYQVLHGNSSAADSTNVALFVFPFYNKFDKDNKQVTQNTIFLYRSTVSPVNENLLPNFDYNQVQIKQIKDVKNPLWDSGFSDIMANGDNSTITNGVKSYKGYSTSIGTLEYVNWIANGMYDLAIYKQDAKNQLGNGSEKQRVYTDVDFTFIDDGTSKLEKTSSARGWIGPGPVCLLALTEEPSPLSVFDGLLFDIDTIPNNIRETTRPLDYLNTDGVGVLYIHNYPGTICANIVHDAIMFSGNDYQFDTYLGFGNYHKNDEDAIVFDGDIYITPCEFVSMYKTYDFKSIYDTLESNQVVYYIPLESRVNTFFDYGMNYRNTNSKNLLLEPGSITGVVVQDRPLHQYNPIYSDNDTSVSVYTAQPLETHTNSFPQRICYSQHKDNGELIDSWNIFKPVDYIDADTRYGEVTNLLSANDTIFFWQDRAFGKLSVNERSLITDNNSNTIQLGQGGVLQRTDYLSTRYGMRLEDYSAINTENGLFWIDILNKAIVANTQNGVVNYGEMLNVQNLINKNITTDKPEIDYDLLNSELLCKCFGANLLVFNIKYNIATAIYTRVYDKILYFNNIMYALNGYNEISQLNYLSTSDETLLLSPTIILFAVNNSPSQTKVFDNQKIVVANKQWNNNIDNMYSLLLTFNTELNQNRLNVLLSEIATNREGNICYAVPRDNDGILRLRGKWMTVKITDNTPELDFAISHIITKFRQSYS